MPKDKYHEHKDDTCPACGERRFDYVVDDNGNHVLDRKGREQQEPVYPPCYYFGVAKTVSGLFNSRVWCAERRAARDGPTMSHTQWGSNYFKRVNNTLGGELFNTDNDAYEVSFDWALAHKRWNTKLEVGVVTLRALGLGTESRGADAYIKTLLLIVTDKKPTDLGPYLSAMHNEFDRLESLEDDGGITVVDLSLNGGAGATIRHRGWLLSAVGDAPTLCMFMGSWSYNAQWGCFRCTFQSCGVQASTGRKHTYPLGYSSPQHQPLGAYVYNVGTAGKVVRTPLPGGRQSITAAEAQRTDHRLLVAFANEAEQELMNHAGGASAKLDTPILKHRSVFWRRPFFDWRWGVLIPIYHCAAYGVCKTFLSHILPTDALRKKRKRNGASADALKPWVITKQKRAVISARSASVSMPAGARAYRDVSTTWSSWTMEECAVFFTALAPAILRDCWPGGDDSPYYQIVLFLSASLRVVFEGTRKRTAAEKAVVKKSFFNLGRLCQEHMPAEMNSPNLHTLVNHAQEQEQETGTLGGTSEMYMERGIRRVLAPVRNRSTRRVGAFIGNSLLHSERVLALYDQLPQAVRDRMSPAVARAAAQLREPPVADAWYFSSRGRVVRLMDVTEHATLKAWMSNNKGVNIDQVQSLSYLRYTSASNGGLEVHSAAYTAAEKRCSRHVALDYGGGRSDRTFYGEVLWFWRVEYTPLGAPQPSIVRLARVRLFDRVTAPTAEAWWGVVNTQATTDTCVEDRLVELDTIKGIVVLVRHAATRHWAMPYRRN